MPYTRLCRGGMDLAYSLFAQNAKIFALQAIPQVHTQMPRPSEPEQGEKHFVKP